MRCFFEREAGGVVRLHVKGTAGELRALAARLEELADREAEAERAPACVPSEPMRMVPGRFEGFVFFVDAPRPVPSFPWLRYEVRHANVVAHCLACGVVAGSLRDVLVWLRGREDGGTEFVCSDACKVAFECGETAW